MKKILRVLWLLPLTASVVTTGWANEEKTKPEIPAISSAERQAARERYLKESAAARETFVYVLTYARLPVEEQRAKLAEFYEYFAQFEQPNWAIISGSVRSRARIPAHADQLTIDELADIVQKQGWNLLLVEAKITGRNLLREHRDLAKPLIEADLRSDQSERMQRGLHVLKQVATSDSGGALALRREQMDTQLRIWLSDFFPHVLRVFQQEETLSQEAAQVFMYLDDARAIQPLLEHDPKQPTKYYEILSQLSHHNPDNPVLLKLLESPDQDTRWQALRSLDSNSQAVVPYLPRLLKDENARVRWGAALRVFRLPPDEFNAMRPTVVKMMLSDPDSIVRRIIAGRFVDRNDRIAARPLWELLRSNTLNKSVTHSVVDDVKKLTGTDFDYQIYVNGDEWRPNTPKNQWALEKFRLWIEANARIVGS